MALKLYLFGDQPSVANFSSVVLFWSLLKIQPLCVVILGEIERNWNNCARLKSRLRLRAEETVRSCARVSDVFDSRDVLNVLAFHYASLLLYFPEV